MEALTHFITQHNETISPKTRIIISFGKGDHMLDCRRSVEEVQGFLKRLGLSGKSHRTDYSRVYRQEHLEYCLARGNGNVTPATCRSTVTDHISHPMEGVRVRVTTTHEHPLEKFPNAVQYHDIFGRVRHVFELQNLVEVHLIVEKREEVEVLMIEVHLTKYNIHQEPLIKVLQTVYNVLCLT